jgi:uncharacterized delta-60 repeat protein
MHRSVRKRALAAALLSLLASCGGGGGDADTNVAAVEASGVVDAGFGTQGAARISALPSGAVLAMLELPDGRLLLGGAAGSPFVAKLTTTGQLDTSFAAGGIDSTRRGPLIFHFVIELGQLSSGQIAVVELHSNPCVGSPAFCGQQSFGDIVARRIDQNGAGDESYGTSGLGILPYSEGSVVVSPNGRVTSFTLRPTGLFGHAFGVASLATNGVRDSGFEERATAAVQCGSRLGASFQLSEASAVAVGEKIVVATVWGSPSPSAQALCVARLNSDGSLDSSFATQGIETFAPSESLFYRLKRVLVRADGEVLVFASPTNDLRPRPPLLIFWLTASGAKDVAMADQGISRDLPWPADVSGIALQPNGKIVMTGYFSTPAGSSSPLDLSRPWAQRALSSARSGDASFGSSGLSMLTTVAGALQPAGIEVGHDGSLFAFGSFAPTGEPAVLKIR